MVDRVDLFFVVMVGRGGKRFFFGGMGSVVVFGGGEGSRVVGDGFIVLELLFRWILFFYDRFMVICVFIFWFRLIWGYFCFVL